MISKQSVDHCPDNHTSYHTVYDIHNKNKTYICFLCVMLRYMGSPRINRVGTFPMGTISFHPNFPPNVTWMAKYMTNEGNNRDGINCYKALLNSRYCIWRERRWMNVFILKIVVNIARSEEEFTLRWYIEVLQSLILAISRFLSHHGWLPNSTSLYLNFYILCVYMSTYK